MMWDEELAVAQGAARAAGAIVREVYERPFEVRQKDAGGDNPVTEADTRADACIHEIIGRAFPDDGWLSEETKDSPARLSRRRCWIVDPLDGTKEFTQHIPELAVCIALVDDGAVVLGVEFNPITDELFAGGRGHALTLNGAPARTSDVDVVAEARILASRSEDKRGEWDPFKSLMKVELTGSVAYKLALIAAGRGDGTFSLTPKHEWDICAGAALIEAGGGRITDCHGVPLRFNQQAKPLLPGIIATNGRLFDKIQAVIQATAPPAPRA
ncbi:MAG: 3'(2'),5'-bisphosphate nucleotidase CysQ [Candidatus Binatia bacterium]